MGGGVGQPQCPEANELRASLLGNGTRKMQVRRASGLVVRRDVELVRNIGTVSNHRTWGCSRLNTNNMSPLIGHEFRATKHHQTC